MVKFVESSVELMDHMGTDLTVVNAARVSFNKHTDVLRESDEKLIKYLASHEHYAPFGHCFLSFRLKVPVFVHRQLIKHEYLRNSEVSRRYVKDEPEFYNMTHFRKAAENIKQGSSDELVAMMHDDFGLVCTIEDVYAEMCGVSLLVYNDLLKSGVCPEQARAVLPLSMMTEVIWSGSLDAFMNMLLLRLDKHTQAETREVAEMIAEHVKRLYPISYKYYVEEKLTNA